MKRLNGLKFQTFIIILLFGSLIGGCQKKSAREKPFNYIGSTMGTTYSIKVSASSNPAALKNLPQEINRLLSKINNLMSTYSPDSEVSRFNSLQKSGWLRVSPETLTVVSEASKISELSGGAFDITMGSLVNLWGFGPKAVPEKIPGRETISKLLSDAGYKKIKIKRDPPSIFKSAPAVSIDLAAIAKGFAVDQTALLLEKKGINNFLAEIGGEIKAKGFKSANQPWLIAIERPMDNARAIHKVAALKNKAIATSGDYRNYYEKNGRRFSHTISPKTGKPITHNLASVSVIADSCMKADAWATALMALGPEAGFKLALKENLAAYFIVRTADGFEEKMTPEFQPFFTPNQPREKSQN